VPLLKIQVNIDFTPARRIQLLKTASELVARMLGKPEREVMVVLETNHEMVFAGDTLPLAYLELKSIDPPDDQAVEFSTRLCGFIEEELEIPPERVYVEFTNPIRSISGRNHKTV
jgi:phenylpyruvate tautomerase